MIAYAGDLRGRLGERPVDHQALAPAFACRWSPHRAAGSTRPTQISEPTLRRYYAARLRGRVLAWTEGMADGPAQDLHRLDPLVM